MKKKDETRYFVTAVASIPVYKVFSKTEAYKLATKDGWGTVIRDENNALVCDEDCSADLYTKNGGYFGIFQEVNTKELPKQAACAAIITSDSCGFSFWAEDFNQIHFFVTYDENGLIDSYRVEYGDSPINDGEVEVAFEDLFQQPEDDCRETYRAELPGTIEYQHKQEVDALAQEAREAAADQPAEGAAGRVRQQDCSEVSKMTFTVYTELAQEVSKKLDRLAKKAAGYGVPFSYTVSEERPQKIAVRDVDSVTQTIQTVSTYTVAAVDFDVECDDLIRANGWTVCAKVEHGDKGNIVTTFGGCKAKPEWYTAAPHCDHCHTNRYRAVTFFCQHEDGSIRQIGRTCLKDYTGISPATAAIWAEVQDLMENGMDCTREQWEEWHPAPMYEVLGILANACDVIREFGYRKTDEPNSTRDMVRQRVTSGEQPSEAGLAEAREVMDWLTAMEPDDASDLERNCITLALSGYAKRNHIGMLAYMPVGHRRKIERQAQQEAAGARSEYVGTVGQRITLKAATVALLSSWDGYYGTTWLYKFVDESGNVFVWFASRPCTAEAGAVIKATVKDHNEREGVKQTVVTRCCVAA